MQYVQLVHQTVLLICGICYSRHDLSPLTSQVYLCLIKMYLSPPNLAEYGIRLPDGSQPEANVNDALRVLTLHHDLIDTAKVCMSSVRVWVGVGGVCVGGWVGSVCVGRWVGGVWSSV